MAGASNLDPFKLVSLSDEIDERCMRIMAKDFSSVVNEESLNEIKEKFAVETLSLMAEMNNEWSELRTRLNIPGFLAEDHVLPNPNEMCSQLKSIYEFPDAEESLDDNEARVRWCANQVQWTVNSWMQVWIQLSHRLKQTQPGDHAVKFERGGGQISLDVPRPSEFNAITRIWQMIRVLTLEYLQKKSLLLTALGEECVEVQIDSGHQRLLSDANRSFWESRGASHVLLLQALRQALIDALGLQSEIAALSKLLPTSTLFAVACHAQVPLSFDKEVLGGIIFDLEKFQNDCVLPDVSYLYPAYRILTEVVKELTQLKLDSSIQVKAAELVRSVR